MSDQPEVSLFESVAAEQRRLALETSQSAVRGLAEFPASATDQVGEILFSKMSSGGFCTLLVPPNTEWDPHSRYFEAARDAAKRGKRIERAFLLPAKHLRHLPALAEHIRLDAEAGIVTHILYIGDLIASLELNPALALDFGIWDDEVACFISPERSGTWRGAATLRVSKRPEHLDAANRLVTTLLGAGMPLDATATTSANDLEEPMLVSAPLAYELAGVLCRGDRVDDDDCAWYHSAWQYLRILNMVSTPTWHERFFITEIASALENVSAPRILVSGTADYSMLAHVLWAVPSKDAIVDVVDLCQTPLVLCQWYGKLVGRVVGVRLEDILDHAPDCLYQLIATDAFLTRFSAEQRPLLLRKWRDLLEPGGVVVTTARIEGGADTLGILASNDEAAQFAHDAERRAERWRDFLPLTPAAIRELALTYSHKMTSHSVASLQEVVALFEEAGFAVEKAAERDVPGEMHKTVYAEIVARRPVSQ